MKFDRTFECRFDARVLGSADESVGMSYSYPGALANSIVEGLYIELTGSTFETWVACFSRGTASPNAATFCGSHPDGGSVFVASKGEGYIVAADDPAKWSALSMNPIMGVVVMREPRLIVVHSFDRFLALGSSGIEWKTGPVSWDGIKNVRVRAELLEADVWDAPSGRIIPVHIDARTGRVSGGAAPNI